VVIASAGVQVESVLPGGAAQAGGVKDGDVLKKLNGQDLTTIEQLQDALRKLYAGDKIALVVGREGKDVEIKDLALQAAPPAAAAVAPAPTPAPAAPAQPKAKQKGVLGIVAGQTDQPSIVVKMVNPGSAAEKAEIKAGDVIRAINGKDVRTFSDLESLLGPVLAGETIKVRVKRGEEEKELQVVLGAAG